MVKVLFVCLGNICRSPMAEAVMNDLVEKEQLNFDIKVSSAGTSGYHDGESAHKGTLRKLREYGIDGSYLVSSKLLEDDFKNYDYIIAMDDSNVENIYDIFTHRNTLDQIKNSGVVIKKLLNKDVPDPWYTGDFEETYTLCLEGCKQLLKELDAKYGN